jgi:cytochrome b561
MTSSILSTGTNNKPQRYHPALVALHWIIAILIFATAFLAMGGEGEGRRGGGTMIAGIPVLGVHMILGLSVLVLLVVRLLIRWRTRHPDWATTGSGLLDKIGALTHWALYFFTFAITITGLILALQSNRFTRVFNPAAGLRGQFTPGQSQPGQLPPPRQFQPGQSPTGEGEGRFQPGGGFFLSAFHGLSWFLLVLLVLVHVGASLYHQFFIKDNLLGRMWFGKLQNKPASINSN